MYRAFILALLPLLTACAAPPQPPDSTAKTIVIVNAGAVGPALAERVRAFAQAHLRVPVTLRQSPSLTTRDLAEAGKMLAGTRTETEVCLIAFVSIDTAPAPPVGGAIMKGTHVALVNVAAMQNRNAEILARRLERQAMRSAAFLLGLHPSPDPFCVTREFSSLADLDRMGRNLCPPWQKKFKEAADKRGLTEPVPHRRKSPEDR